MIKCFNPVTGLLATTAMLCLGESRAPALVALERPGFSIEYDSADKPIPRWSNGYLVAVDTQPERAPLVSVFGPGASKLFSRQLEMDAVARVIPRAVAAAKDARFAVAGSAYDATGTGTNFIAYLDRNGDLTRVVRLNGFAAMQMIFTDDGRLWVAGRTLGPRDQTEVADQDIVRIYGRDGVLERTALPRSRLPHKNHPAIGGAYLSANRVGVVFFSSRTGYLARLLPTGEVEAISHVPLPQDVLVTGFTVSDSSQFVISTQRSNGPQSEIAEIGLLQSSGTGWTIVSSRESGDTEKPSLVFGFEGNDLLVGSLNPRPKFKWARVGP